MTYYHELQCTRNTAELLVCVGLVKLETAQQTNEPHGCRTQRQNADQQSRITSRPAKKQKNKGSIQSPLASDKVHDSRKPQALKPNLETS